MIYERVVDQGNYSLPHMISIIVIAYYMYHRHEFPLYELLSGKPVAMLDVWTNLTDLVKRQHWATNPISGLVKSMITPCRLYLRTVMFSCHKHTLVIAYFFDHCLLMGHHFYRVATLWILLDCNGFIYATSVMFK